MKPYYGEAQASGAGNVHRKLVYADSVEHAEAILQAFYTKLWSELCQPIQVSAELLEGEGL